MLMDGSSLREAKKRSVEGKLRERGHRVESHAFDGFTTHSVLGTDTVGAVLPKGGPYRQYYQQYMNEKAGAGDQVSPLERLRKKVSERPRDTHYVAISVAGNDFRVNLLNPWRLIRDISGVQKRYLKILEQVKGIEGDVRPMMIFQYRTDAKNDPYRIYSIFGALGAVAVTVHLACFALLAAPIAIFTGGLSAMAGGIAGLGGAVGLYATSRVVPLSVTKNVLTGGKFSHSMLGGMLESFYQPMIAQAKKDRIPILDLPNTFNPFDDLYDCGIEPNEKGGALIAEGIDHIIQHHNYGGESALYAKPKGQAAFASRQTGWRVEYPKID
jgi:hypothetical protein